MASYIRQAVDWSMENVTAAHRAINGASSKHAETNIWCNMLLVPEPQIVRRSPAFFYPRRLIIYKPTKEFNYPKA